MSVLSDLKAQQKAIAQQIQEEEDRLARSGETVTIDGVTISDTMDIEGELPEPELTDLIPTVKKDDNGDIIPEQVGEISIQRIIELFGSDVTTSKDESLSAIQSALTSALASIGESDSAGARGQAISSISTALQNALNSIGQSDSTGARGSALTAIASALQNALSSIGQSDTEGARKAAIDSINAKSTSVNSALDQKLATANTTIDGKVTEATNQASAAASAKTDAESARDQAQEILEDVQAAANVSDASETTKGIMKLFGATGSATDGTMTQASITAALTNLQTTIMGNFELTASSYVAAVTA